MTHDASDRRSRLEYAVVTAIFLTGPDVEADGRTDAHAADLQTDGCARPHVQWCVANCTVWTDVPADAAAHGEPDDRARPGSHVSRQCRQSNARAPSTIAPSMI